jgi:GT2 family glycosyltransferase
MERNRPVRASIIIVCHNGLYNNTVACLESVLGNTSCEEDEIIVVDNNSSDGTQEYLRELSIAIPHLRLVLNGTNKGFPGGNNDGIRMSRGDYLVLLNNDTLVTEGWVTELLRPLSEDTSIGLVGPVSNALGNEQLIFTAGNSPEEVLAEGRKWCEASRGDRFYTDMLSFFCVAMRKDLVESVGLLDERFGLGYFEDNDYCMRVKKAGYTLVCLEDVFVYHRGSGSFDTRRQAVHQLLKRNQKLLEKKFGIKFRPRHPRDLHLDLIQAYLTRIGPAGPTPGLVYKINNRLKILEKIKPRGWIKKLRFRRRMRSLGLAPYLHGK